MEHSRGDWNWCSCLNYDAWYNATQSYLADYRWPCEPYLLGATSSVPLRELADSVREPELACSWQMPFFDERFIHYGNDKAQVTLHGAILASDSCRSTCSASSTSSSSSPSCRSTSWCIGPTSCRGGPTSRRGALTLGRLKSLPPAFMPHLLFVGDGTD